MSFPYCSNLEQSHFLKIKGENNFSLTGDILSHPENPLMRSCLVEREGSFNLGNGCQPHPPYTCLPPRTLFVGEARNPGKGMFCVSSLENWETHTNTPASPSSHSFMVHSFIYSSHIYWVALISSCLKLSVEILYFQGFSLVYFQFYFIYWAKTFEQLSIPKVLGTPPRGGV